MRHRCVMPWAQMQEAQQPDFKPVDNASDMVRIFHDDPCRPAGETDRFMTGDKTQMLAYGNHSEALKASHPYLWLNEYERFFSDPMPAPLA
jgi:hypothetical protein